MEEKLTKLMPTIVSLATVYYRKMRKPNIHSISDLVSEGQLVVVKVLLKNQQVVYAYVLQCIKNHFKALLNQTYKQNGKYFYLEEGNNGHLDKRTTNFSTLEIDVWDNLTQEQKTYVAQVITIPRTYKKAISIIRTQLQLSIEDERRIRQSLFKLAKGRVDENKART